MDLDSMPLRLSGNNSDADEDLDGFDFALGDDVHDDRLFVTGSSDIMMEENMHYSGSNDMHFDFC